MMHGVFTTLTVLAVVGFPLAPMHICEPWAPMTLLPVHWFSFLGPLLVPGTPHNICCFRDALIQSCSYDNLAKVVQILKLIFLPPRLQEPNVHLLPNVSHPIHKCHCKKIVNVIYVISLTVVLMLWLIVSVYLQKM